ncbi:MAG: FimV/HubP family polar landmark protein [Cellvibrionaceae bacterium]
MHLRKLTFIVGFVGALCCTGAHGLGLGEITLNSTLNEPLDAEIKLLQVRNLTEEDILIKLASAEDFRRFGVSRIFFLQSLKFDVQLDHPDGPMIRVTTDEPVREPYLIFLLEAESSGGGRLLREYTLLMDIPVFADRPAQPVQGVRTAPPEPQQAQPTAPPTRQAEPRQQAQEPPRAPARPAQQRQQGEPPRAQPAPAPVRSVSAGSSAEEYLVEANDTLWEIALRVRPTSDVSVQQTMLALQRLNPDAFIDGNINRLKRGQVLRLPDQGEIETLDQRSAIGEVAYQNNRWAENRGGPVAGAELEASRTRPATQSDSQTRRGQLTLAAPGDTQGAAERSGAGDTSARTDALENELAITAEELDATRRENEELNTRVTELEAQIATMERLIEVSSEEMRALQLAAEQAGVASDTGAAPAGTESEAGTDTAPDQIAEEDQASGDQPQADAPTQAVDGAGPEPVAQPTRTVVPQAQAPQPTIVDLLMANLWYLLVALLAILGGVVYFLHRRSQAEMETFDDMDDDDLFADDGQTADDEFLSETAEFDDQPAFDTGEQAAIEEEVESDAPVEPETGDAVAEADIYIAYGKFDQAEEMLQKALVNEPNNVDARLKLLEVYADTKDVGKFDHEYGQLLSMGDAAATARAAELRGGIPGAGQFEGEPGVADARGDGLDFSSDDFGGELSVGTDASSAAQADDGDARAADGLGDLSIDFDGSAPVPSEAGSDQDDAFDFNFDLDSDGEDKLDVDQPVGAIDFNEEFAAADDTGGDGEQPAAEGEGLDFSLDLDSAIDNADMDETDPGETAEHSKLSLDLDLGEEGDADSDLSLDLDDDGFSAPGDGDDDILSDLEFSATTLTDTDTESEAEQTESRLESSNSKPAPDADDDFDMNMGDLDLAALDQEMDALVGDLDDPVDDDVAVVSPTETVPALNEKTAAGVEDDFSLDDLGSSDLDDSDWSTPHKAGGNSADEFAFGEDQDVGVDEDLDSELDFLADTDEVATKLDLARAYIDMGDQDGAKDILDEVSSEGNDQQKREAAELLEKMV